MAGAVPLERNDREIHHEAPGAFPVTPANDMQQFYATPLPATSNAPVPGGEGSSNPIKLAPGESVPHPSTYTDNKIDTFAKSANDESAFGVAPLPATSGIGNPIKLAPGEPVPHPSTFTNNTVHSTVSDLRSASGAPQLPVLTPDTVNEANGGHLFDVPALGSGRGPMIPESSLPMGPGANDFIGGYAGPHISSVAPQSTSAVLAGQVPIRERGVPEVVTESNTLAHQSPEAAAYTDPVEQKSAMEDELRAVVPEARGVDAVGHGNAAEVPPVVSESQNRAGASNEATASPTAVDDKTAMEDELLSKVPQASTTSSSGVFGASEKGIVGAVAGGAVAAGGVVAAAAYAAKEKAQAALDQNTTTSTTAPTTISSADTVPTEVIESQKAAHVSPEASAVPEAVHEKSAMEKELMAKVPEAPTTSESGLLGKSEQGLTGKATAGIAAGTAAAGAAIATGIYAARDKTADVTGYDKDQILPPSVASAIDSMNNNKGTTAPSTTGATNGFTTASVPTEVKESQRAAHVSPEASANPEAVAEKSKMEKELLREVPPATQSGDPAPTAVASALSATGPSATTSSGFSLSPPGEPSMGAPPAGLNAGANSQAQSLATKTGALANSEQVRTDNTHQDTAIVGNTANPPSSNLTHSATSRPATAKEVAERATGPTATTVGASTSSKETAPVVAATSPNNTNSEFRDEPVSPRSTPSRPATATAAAAPVTTPTSTPTKDKRMSTPLSNKTAGKMGTTEPESPSVASETAKPKKKGFLSKLKEKLGSK